MIVLFRLFSVLCEEKGTRKEVFPTWQSCIRESEGYDWDSDVRDDPYTWTDDDGLSHQRVEAAFEDRTVPVSDDAGAGSSEAGMSSLRAGSIKELQLVHDTMVKLLQGYGVDACKEMHKNSASAVLARVHGEVRKCEICGVVKKTKKSLKIHIQFVHMGHTPYKCTKCKGGKFFQSSAGLLSHKDIHHSKKSVKEFKCEKCPKIFAKAHLRNAHQKTHDEEEHKCTYCNEYSTGVKSNLTAHLKVCPTSPHFIPEDKRKEKKFFCTCNRGYARRRELTRHIRAKQDVPNERHAVKQ